MKRTLATLASISQSGYCIDEWSLWQQGRCLTYATALIQLSPQLLLGTLDQGRHFFAHDASHAYDSAGRHPLPYRGISGDMDQLLDIGDDYGTARDEEGAGRPELARAARHARRNGIMDGRFGLRSVQGL